MQLRQKVLGLDWSHPTASTEHRNSVEIYPRANKMTEKLGNSNCNDVVHLEMQEWVDLRGQPSTIKLQGHVRSRDIAGLPQNEGKHNNSH